MLTPATAATRRSRLPLRRSLMLTRIRNWFRRVFRPMFGGAPFAHA